MLQGPESRRRNCDAVGADREKLLVIGAVVLGRRGAGEVGFSLGQGDRGVSNGGAGGIGDAAGETGGAELRHATRTEQRGQEKYGEELPMDGS
jgi:hypothetical protein